MKPWQRYVKVRSSVSKGCSLEYWLGLSDFRFRLASLLHNTQCNCDSSLQTHWQMLLTGQSVRVSNKIVIKGMRHWQRRVKVRSSASKTPRGLQSGVLAGRGGDRRQEVCRPGGERLVRSPGYITSPLLLRTQSSLAHPSWYDNNKVGLIRKIQ